VKCDAINSDDCVDHCVLAYDCVDHCLLAYDSI